MLQPTQRIILPPPAPRRGSFNRWLPWLVLGGIGVTGIVMLLVLVGLVGIAYLSQDRIPARVTVAGIQIGGKSPDDAAALLTKQFASQPITLTDGDRQWTVKPADIGVQVDIPSTIKAAEQAQPGTALQPRYNVDLSQTQNGLVALSDQINIPAVPGDQPQDGRSLDIPVVLDRLRTDVTGELADHALDLNMIDVPPPAPEPSSTYTGATTTHVVERGQELGLIAKEYNVSMDDIVKMNNISNPDLLYVGQQLVIPAAGIYEPTAADSPPAPTSTGKSILVSLSQQRIYAYQDGQMIHSHLVSTGLPGTPTVLGDYKIKVKLLADDMSGPGYFLPQVPYTMYFYQGYAIHGTYWHNAFGRPMSHGCVNLPTDEAKWFFDWAEVGTPVRVIA